MGSSTGTAHWTCSDRQHVKAQSSPADPTASCRPHQSPPSIVTWVLKSAMFSSSMIFGRGRHPVAWFDLGCVTSAACWLGSFCALAVSRHHAHQRMLRIKLACMHSGRVQACPDLAQLGRVLCAGILLVLERGAHRVSRSTFARAPGRTRVHRVLHHLRWVRSRRDHFRRLEGHAKLMQPSRSLPSNNLLC
jgi:hypothetical protein